MCTTVTMGMMRVCFVTLVSNNGTNSRYFSHMHPRLLFHWLMKCSLDCNHQMVFLGEDYVGEANMPNITDVKSTTAVVYWEVRLMLPDVVENYSNRYYG